MKSGSIFELAILQLRREGKKDITLKEILTTGYNIRKFFDKHPRIANRILEGKPISAQLKYKYKKLGVYI